MLWTILDLLVTASALGLTYLIYREGTKTAFRDLGIPEPEPIQRQTRPSLGAYLANLARLPAELARVIWQADMPDSASLARTTGDRIYLAYGGVLANLAAMFAFCGLAVSALATSLLIDHPSDMTADDINVLVAIFTTVVLVLGLLAWVIWRERKHVSYAMLLASVAAMAMLFVPYTGQTTTYPPVDTSFVTEASPTIHVTMYVMLFFSFCSILNGLTVLAFSLPVAPMPGGFAWGAVVGKIFGERVERGFYRATMLLMLAAIVVILSFYAIRNFA